LIFVAQLQAPIYILAFDFSNIYFYSRFCRLSCLLSHVTIILLLLCRGFLVQSFLQAKVTLAAGAPRIPPPPPAYKAGYLTIGERLLAFKKNSSPWSWYNHLSCEYRRLSPLDSALSRASVLFRDVVPWCLTLSMNEINNIN
jgi:hypothetical protein